MPKSVKTNYTEVGPIHIHHGVEDMGYPRTIPALPEFMIEFGEEGEDYGGCVVYYPRSYPRERDGYVQSYNPKLLASLIANAPNVLAENKELKIKIKELESKGVKND